MANPITLSDVEDRFYRPLTDRELINTKAWLSDAWWLLTARLPNLEANLTAELIPLANVRRVVVAMVHRLLKNPEGFVTESIDDYSYRRATLVASGALSLEHDERALLIPGGRRKVHSHRLRAYGE